MYTRASRVHPAVARKPCETFIIQSPRIEGTRREWNSFRLDIFLFPFSSFLSSTNESRKGREKCVD